MIHKTVREIAAAWKEYKAAFCKAVHDGGLCVNLGEPRPPIFRGR